MSRVLFIVILWLLPGTVLGQADNPVPTEMAVFVKNKSEELLQVEGREPKKCREPAEGEDIVVCGVIDKGEDQLVFGDPAPDEDRIRRGEAVSVEKAAACIGGYPACSHRLHKLVGTGFGKVPPPAISLEEVYRGLPEPDVVVPEGSPADYAGIDEQPD